MTDVYYRYEDFLQGTGGWDVCGEWEPGPSVVRVQVLTYPVVRKTPKGAWINVDGETRFIADHWNKKHANPTSDGAKADFIARKKRLIAIQSHRIRNAEQAIAIAEQDRRVHGTRLIGMPAILSMVI